MLLPLLLLAAAQTTAGGTQSDVCCVEPGDCIRLDFIRPALDQPGDPVGASWQNGNGIPQLYDHDYRYDDLMGPGHANADGSQASGQVYSNTLDMLYGENGEVQNHGFEGRCIEVYMCWTYRYPVTIFHANHSYAGKPASGGTLETIWRTCRKYSSRKKVCPC